MTQVCERGSSPGAHLHEGIWWDNPMFGFHLCIFQFRESSMSGLWAASFPRFTLICVPFQRFQATCSALSTLVRIFFPMYFPRWWSLMIVTALLVSSTTYLKVNGLNDLAVLLSFYSLCCPHLWSSQRRKLQRLLTGGVDPFSFAVATGSSSHMSVIWNIRHCTSLYRSETPSVDIGNIFPAETALCNARCIQIWEFKLQMWTLKDLITLVANLQASFLGLQLIRVYLLVVSPQCHPLIRDIKAARRPLSNGKYPRCKCSPFTRGAMCKLSSSSSSKLLGFPRISHTK